MRDYKFRGKRKDNGEWVYGSLSVEYDGTPRIGFWVNTLIEPENNFWEPIHDCYEVIPETVGQYTGLKDKNKTEIFEGDIISHNDNVFILSWYEEPKSAAYGLVLRERRRPVNWRGLEWLNNVQKYCQIIGNTHSNPELIQ